MNTDFLKLENQLCFPLYTASRTVIRKYKTILDKYDLTYTQYIALMVLWESDNINVKELGNRLYLDSGTKNDLKNIPCEIGKCINLSEEEALNLYKTLYKIINAEDIK